MASLGLSAFPPGGAGLKSSASFLSSGRISAFKGLCLILVCLFTACTAAPEAPVSPIEDIELPASGTFTVMLSGAIESDYAGSTEAVISPMGRAIYLTGEQFSANLVLPAEQFIGTYAVVPLLDAFDSAQNVQRIGGLLIDSTPPTVADSSATPDQASPLDAVWYDRIVEGRVTLLSIDPMTGAFEYTVADEAGQSIRVRAVFNELPQTGIAP